MFSGGVCAGTTCPYKDIILSLLRQICPYKDRWRFLRVKKAVGSERAPPPKAMRFPPAPLFLDHKTSFFVRFSVSQNKDSCPYKDRICGKGSIGDSVLISKSCPYLFGSEMVRILHFCDTRPPECVTTGPRQPPSGFHQSQNVCFDHSGGQY